MSLSKRFCLVVLLSGVVLSLGLALRAQETEVRRFEAPPTDKQIQTESARAERAAGRLTVGGRIGESTSEGYLDILQPLMGGQNALLFLNPKLSGNDDDESEWSIGIGGRILLPGPNVILGANVFYDERETRRNNRFGQVGAGVEVLSQWVDARGNYYWPDDKERVIESDSETSVRQSSRSWWGDIYGRQHQLKQNYYTRRTTTSTTRYFDRFEAALEGYDLELGVRLPYLPDWLETRVFGGYYSFDGEFTDAIDGFKGRLEVRALPALVLDAEVYENKELTGSDYFVGLRLESPFDLWNLAHGRNPFEGIGESARPTRREMRDRLSDMVMRDPHVRMHESGWIEDPSRAEVKNSSRTSSKGHVILDDVNFVNNANQTGIENGTAEHPWHLVQEGVDAVFGEKNVYVFQGIAPYDEHVRVGTDGVKLRGEGTAIPGFAGKIFGGNKYPVMSGVVGGVNAPAMTVTADDVFITGFDFARNTGLARTPFALVPSEDREGIFAANANRLLIDNNKFSGQDYGIEILVENMPNYQATVQNNQFEDNASAIYAGAYDSGNVSFVFVNNVVERSLDAGILIESSNLSGNFATHLEGNRVSGSGEDGIYIWLDQIAGNVNLSLLQNDLRDNEYVGYYAEMEHVDGSVFLDVINNLLLNNGDEGAYLNASLIGGDVSAAIVGNQASENRARGIYFYSETIGGNASAYFANNRVENNEDAGLFVGILDAVGATSILVEDTVARGNGDNGISVVAWGAGDGIDVHLNRNVTTGNARQGVDVSTYAPFSSVHVGIEDLVAHYNEEGGLRIGITAFLPPNQTAFGTIDISNSSLNYNDGNGLAIIAGATNSTEVYLYDLEAIGNSDNGVRADLAASASVLAVAEDVVASDNGKSGVDFIINSGVNAYAYLVGSEFHGNGEDGAAISVSGNYIALLSLQNVAMNGNGDNGLRASVDGGDAVAGLSVESSQFLSNGIHGISSYISGEQFAVAMMSDVEASHNVADGINLSLENLFNFAAVGVGNITVSDNGGYGAAFEVVGASQALFQGSDIFASGNGIDGLLVEGNSASGQSEAELFDSEFAGNGALGANLNLTGGAEAYVYVADVRSHGNLGGGMEIDAESLSGDVNVGVYDSEFSDNTGDGLVVNAAGGLYVMGTFDGLLATNNASGFLGTFNSASNGLDVLLENSAFAGNSQNGAALNFLAQEDAVVVANDVVASGNGELGLFMFSTTVAGANEISISNGTFNSNGDLGVTAAAMTLGTNGARVGVRGVFHADGNSTGALFLALSPLGNATVDVVLGATSTADNNTGHGIVGAAQGIESSAIVDIAAGAASFNGRYGVVVVASATNLASAGLANFGLGNGEGAWWIDSTLFGSWQDLMP